MAGVKLTTDGKLKLKLLVGFYRAYHPQDAIDRDTIIDFAISDFAPLDLEVVWNGKNYALQCRACGFAAVRPATMVRHLWRGCESTKSTLDIRAHTGANERRNEALDVLAQPAGLDGSTLDIAQTAKAGEPTASDDSVHTKGSDR